MRPLFRHLVLLVFTTSVVLSADPGREASPAPWLARVNLYRAMAGLPPVNEEPSLSNAVLQHARYMVRNDRIEHRQNARDRLASAAGAEAAAASNLAGSTSPAETDEWAVDTWMQAPFHALGILDPGVVSVGFGIHRAADGRIQTAAGLDIIRGRRPVPRGQRYPVIWPGDGSVVPMGAHLSEYPDPLSACPGYAAPAGLPLVVQLGTGGKRPELLASYVAEDGVAIEHCVFDEATYRNRDGREQALGRSILAVRDAIVVIPRRPLRRGAGYRVVIEVLGERRIDWSFAVGGPATTMR